MEKYYSKLTLDFDINKRVTEDVAIIQTKRLRNKIAGFTTVSAVRQICKMLIWMIARTGIDMKGNIA